MTKNNIAQQRHQFFDDGVKIATFTTQTAASAVNFVGSIGVNTHLDFSGSTYNNIKLIENAVEYLGIKNLRDSPESNTDIGASGLWQQVADATGAKFDAYIGEGSPAGMTVSLSLITSLAQQGILNFVEGGNEEDDPFAVSSGNSLAQAASFQKQLYATAHQWGLPVINMSFGQGWGTSSTGDYGTVGNLAAYADYANAHTYFGTGNTPLGTIETLNSDAQLAANGKSVITTEMGWYTTGSAIDPSSVSQTVQAKYMLDGLLDAYQAGDAKTYLYELIDQHASTGSEDNFGLFNADGTAKPAAAALHNLTSLLADNGGSFTPGSLSYALSGTLSTDHSLLLEKSDETFWLALWNETRLADATAPIDIAVPNHTVTLSLAATAGSVTIYDPLTGISAVQSASAVQSIQLSLPDHPILVEITPSGATPTPITGSSAAFVPPPAPVDTNPAHDTTIAVPASVTVDASQSIAVAGVSIADVWAQNHSGSMALNLSVDHGSLGIAGQTGSTISLSGSLSQLNADLATLDFSAPASPGPSTLTVNVWNQAGYSVTETIGIGTMLVANNDEAAIARLYTAALGRTPDMAEVTYWNDIFQNNISAAAKAQGQIYSLGEAGAGYNGTLSIAGGFTNSAEFQSTYGTLSNDAFVHQLYVNALGRAGEPAGVQYWDNLLDSGTETREMVLVSFALSPENIKNSMSWLTVV